MGRYLLYISYLGSRYRGAQKSIPNGPLLDPDSIQGAIECALANFSPKCVEIPTITLSSRTDSGVHALKSAVHADIKTTNGCYYEPVSLQKFINRYFTKCDHDIRILECIPVTDQFHARYRATSRTYMYRFIVPKIQDDHGVPILEKNRAYFINDANFNIDKVREGLKHFQGVKNFETFAARIKNRYEKNIVYVRRLTQFKVEEAKPFMTEDPLSENFRYYAFTCQSRSFLYNQVRRMVGSLISLGSNKITIKELREMIEVPNIKSFNPKVMSASPHGLYLCNVDYDKEQLESYKVYPNENCEFQKADLNLLNRF